MTSCADFTFCSASGGLLHRIPLPRVQKRRRIARASIGTGEGDVARGLPNVLAGERCSTCVVSGCREEEAAARRLLLRAPWQVGLALVAVWDADAARAAGGPMFPNPSLVHRLDV